MTESELREQIIHSLRLKGWSKTDAEEEADEKLRRLYDKAKS